MLQRHLGDLQENGKQEWAYYGALRITSVHWNGLECSPPTCTRPEKYASIYRTTASRSYRYKCIYNDCTRVQAYNEADLNYHYTCSFETLNDPTRSINLCNGNEN